MSHSFIALLLRLYPRPFRERFGEEIVQFLRDEAAGRRHVRWFSRMIGSVSAAHDLLCGAGVEQARHLRSYFNDNGRYGPMHFGVVNVFFGFLIVAGGAQAMVLGGIFNGEPFPLAMGAMGSAAGLLVVAAGAARIRRPMLTPEATVFTRVALWVALVFHISGALPPNHIVGIGMSLVVALVAGAQLLRRSQATATAA